MAKKFVWATVLLMLCVSIHYAFALGSLTFVTKENQAELGLNFTLVAERTNEDTVSVHMEIPKKGNLKNLRSVSMVVRPGKPLVSATLETTPNKKGSWVVMFQVAPDLADKCYIHLVVPSAPRTYAIYAVELKGYMTAKK